MRGEKWILASFLLFYLADGAICQGSDTWSTAVFEFEMLGEVENLEKGLGELAPEWLIFELRDAKRFEFVDLKEAARIMKEEVGMRDLINPDKINRIGKMHGWQIAIQGKIMVYGDSVDVYASILDIQTARVIQTVGVTGKVQKKDISGIIKELIAQLALDIRSVFPPKGEVVAIQKDAPEKQVILNKGKIHGLQREMRFEIYKTKKIAEDVFGEINLATVEATEVTKENCFARIHKMEGDTPIEKGHKFRVISFLGRLDITTEPPVALISVSKGPSTGFNTPIGLNTPATIHLQPGNYTISLSKPGFVTWSDSVTIEPYETTRLSADLTKLKFSIVSPPSEVRAREAYPLIVQDYRGQHVSVDEFDWIVPLSLVMKREQGEAKIKISDVKQRSKVILEGTWKQDRMGKATQEITILPRGWIPNIIRRHKYISAGVGVGVLAVIAYTIYKLVDGEEDKEGNVEITFTF